MTNEKKDITLDQLTKAEPVMKKVRTLHPKGFYVNVNREAESDGNELEDYTPTHALLGALHYLPSGSSLPHSETIDKVYGTENITKGKSVQFEGMLDEVTESLAAHHRETSLGIAFCTCCVGDIDSQIPRQIYPTLKKFEERYNRFTGFMLDRDIDEGKANEYAFLESFVGSMIESTELIAEALGNEPNYIAMGYLEEVKDYLSGMTQWHLGQIKISEVPKLGDNSEWNKVDDIDPLVRVENVAGNNRGVRESQVARFLEKNPDYKVDAQNEF